MSKAHQVLLVNVEKKCIDLDSEDNKKFFFMTKSERVSSQ